MADTPRIEVSKVARAKDLIKKPWALIKSKLKSIRRVKQPIQVISSHKRVEIDPAPRDSVELAPASQDAALSIDISATEGNHSLTHSVHTKPSHSSLSGLSGLRKLKDSLISPAPKQETTENASPSALLDRPPEVVGQPETAPQHQGSCPGDSVRSDKAAFGDTYSAVSDTIRIAPNQPQNSPVETLTVQKAPVQATPTQIPRLRVASIQVTPAQVQFPLVNQIEKKMEVPRLVIPGFTSARPKGTPLQHPGMLSPPLTPSSQIRLVGPQNAQQKTPVMLADLFLSPSPVMVVPALGTPTLPKPTTPTTPNTPIMPPTPIEQGTIPGATNQTPNVTAKEPPALLPRSPRRPPPPGLVPIPTAAGRDDFGVIGDRRAPRNQPQPLAVEEFEEKLDGKENVPVVKLEPAPTSDGADGARDPEDQDSPELQPIRRYSKPIYVGEQKYYVGRHLGGGAMGKVYSVVSRTTMGLSALKVVRRKNLNLGYFSLVKGEWAILKAISEAKFVRTKGAEGLRFVHHLVESWYDKDHIYFIMPLCVGSLRNLLRMTRLDPLTIRVYSAELMYGLEALHDMRIMHCDLKPDNVLVYPDGHLSIADFGLSVSWLDPRYKNYPSHAFRGRRLGGTDGYMAPELVSAIQNPSGPRRGNFGFAADIWSMGVLIAELGMRGRRLVFYEDEEERECWKSDYTSFSRAMILSREKLMKRVKKHLQGDHAMLVERMTEFNEASRPDFDEIASHPFFSDLDLARVLHRGYSVPIPPFELVLPCRHTRVEDDWFSSHSNAEEQDETLPNGVLEHDEVRALCLTRDVDRYIIPEDFVWDVDKAVRLAAIGGYPCPSQRG